MLARASAMLVALCLGLTPLIAPVAQAQADEKSTWPSSSIRQTPTIRPTQRRWTAASRVKGETSTTPASPTPALSCRMAMLAPCRRRRCGYRSTGACRATSRSADWDDCPGPGVLSCGHAALSHPHPIRSTSSAYAHSDPSVRPRRHPDSQARPGGMAELLGPGLYCAPDGVTLVPMDE